VKEGEYGRSITHSCMKTKMRPVETIQRMGRRGIKENDRRGEFS
jgi:hypothetical protein